MQIESLVLSVPRNSKKMDSETELEEYYLENEPKERERKKRAKKDPKFRSNGKPRRLCGVNLNPSKGLVNSRSKSETGKELVTEILPKDELEAMETMDMHKEFRWRTIHQYLLCKVCDKPPYEPIVLQCGHFMCRDCLITVIQVDAEENQTRPECPQCRHVILHGHRLIVSKDLSTVMEMVYFKENEHSNSKRETGEYPLQNRWNTSKEISQIVLSMKELRMRKETLERRLFVNHRNVAIQFFTQHAELSDENAIEVIREGGFPIAVFDPPWDYRASHFGGTAHEHYSLQDDDFIYSLPISGLMADHAVLLVWATFPRLDVALEFGQRAGFRLTTVFFTWVKIAKGEEHEERKALCRCGSYTRANAEVLLMFSRGNITRYRRNVTISSILTTEAREMSRKPDESIEMIMKFFQCIPMFEGFARETRPFWYTWGNEINHFPKPVGDELCCRFTEELMPRNAWELDQGYKMQQRNNLKEINEEQGKVSAKRSLGRHLDTFKNTDVMDTVGYGIKEKKEYLDYMKGKLSEQLRNAGTK